MGGGKAEDGGRAKKEVVVGKAEEEINRIGKLRNVEVKIFYN
jgi:hypothetical protein